MQFVRPRRRECPGKAARYPIAEQRPIEWLLTDKHAYETVFPLDGFVVHIKSKAVTAIFKKLPVQSLDLDDPNGRLDLARTLISNNRIVTLAYVAQLLKVPFYVFAWNHDLGQNEPTDETASSILAIQIALSSGVAVTPSIKAMTLADFRGLLRFLRGGTFAKAKELVTADTSLECYLANKSALDGSFDPWPGDLDALIFDLANKTVKTIIEFKTHNMKKPVSEEWLGKYPRDDARRVQVLFDLRDAIGSVQTSPPSLRYVVWGTGNYEEHAEVLVSDILSLDDLKGSTRTMLSRPAFGEYSEELYRILSANPGTTL